MLCPAPHKHHRAQKQEGGRKETQAAGEPEGNNSASCEQTGLAGLAADTIRFNRTVRINKAGGGAETQIHLP